MRSFLLVASIVCWAALLMIGCNKPQSSADSQMAPDSAGRVSGSAVALKTDMRKLWEDHITWTRNVICCLVDDLPGTDAAMKRLMKNQDDIGDAVKSYYGADAGKALTTLLHNHIAISGNVVISAKKNDKTGLELASKEWTVNADSIAIFLSGANPHWKLDDMKTMMHDHLKYTTDEAVARIKKDYSADVSAYDNVHNEILKMADMLTDGIVAQYPDKFAK